MKKMESVLMVILMVFTFGLAGCGTAPSLSSPPPGTTSLGSLGIPLWIIEDQDYFIEGTFAFWRKMDLLLTGGANIEEGVSLLLGFSLIEGITTYLESIKKSDTILILPWGPEGVPKYRELETKYPNLCPLSCDELESELEFYSSPLIYFSQDIQADKIRGIIVANQVDALLAELLSVEVPLDVSFRYEDGQLQILE